MEAYWKVKIALVYKDSMYVHSKDLGYMPVEDAKEYAQEEADHVYNRFCDEFNLPSFVDCAQDIFEDIDAEDIWGLDEADLEFIEKHFNLVKSLYLSWKLEEVK